MEIWKNIEDFDDYQISNFGKVKSFKYNKIRLLKPGIDGRGYRNVGLCKSGKKYTKKIHTLVYDHFGNKKRNGMILQVDHIDNDKLNNHIDNLQLLSNRKNCSKGKLLKPKSSRFTGVCFDKQAQKWKAQAQIDTKVYHIGLFENEEDAKNAYLNFIRNLKT